MSNIENEKKRGYLDDGSIADRAERQRLLDVRKKRNDILRDAQNLLREFFANRASIVTVGEYANTLIQRKFAKLLQQSFGITNAASLEIIEEQNDTKFNSAGQNLLKELDFLRTECQSPNELLGSLFIIARAFDQICLANNAVDTKKLAIEVWYLRSLLSENRKLLPISDFVNEESQLDSARVLEELQLTQISAFKFITGNEFGIDLAAMLYGMIGSE